MCLVFANGSKWGRMIEEERKSFMGNYLAYEAELRQSGCFLGGMWLPALGDIATVRFRQGRSEVSGSSDAGNPERLSGVLFLDCRDLNHAIQLVSGPWTTGVGTFEIRIVEPLPADLILRREPSGRGCSRSTGREER